MFRALTATALVVLLATAALAQDTVEPVAPEVLTPAPDATLTPEAAPELALTDPSAPLPDPAPVVSQCQIVAGNPESADAANGICIGATRSFVAALAGKPAAEVDKAIVDLVSQLAPLPEGKACDVADEEIAAAIRLASQSVSDPDMLAQMTEIAQTVQDCSTGETAALQPDPFSPA